MIISIKNCVIKACEGADHRFEFERPTLREVKRMQEAAGIDIGDFEDGMNDFLESGLSGRAIDVLLALVDILHRRDGIRVAFEEVDLDMPGLDFEFEGEDEDVEEQAGDETGKADPARTSPSQPPADEAEDAPASGDATEAESEPKSAPTPPSSGGGTA